MRKSLDLRRILSVCACSILMAFGAGAISAQETSGSEWVTSWSASPQAAWEGDFPLPTLLPFNLWGQTLRQPLRISLGGETFRIMISNEYGSESLIINDVHVAMTKEGGGIDPETDHTVTFSGQSTFSIPAGAPMVSDPIPLKVANFTELSVSMFFPSPTPVETFHWDAQATSYIAPGDQVDVAELTDAGPISTRIFLSEIIVEAEMGVRGVVAYGDSITDGAASGSDLNARWPDYLAENFASENVAVVNAGISGARLLQSQMGENALARFDRDVLARPNVETVVILLGINDIAWPGQLFAPNDPFLSVEELKAGFLQLATRAHMNDVRVVVGTLTPFEDALLGSPLEGYYTEERDALRREINGWIRTSDSFDAVVDFDLLLADPDNNARLLENYQADYLHMSPAGNKAVADALTPEVLFGNG